MVLLTRRSAIVAAGFTLAMGPFLAADGWAETTPTADADGKAEGTLTVNGKITKVAFAYARSVPGFFDEKVEDILVIVSDIPLDRKALADRFVRGSMATKGKLHAFEITINAAGAPISTAWYHNGFKGPSPSGLSSADVFTKKVLDNRVVEGSYKSATEAQFFGSTSAFDVSFRASIAH